MSIFKVDLVEDGEDPVILLMFVRNFDTVTEVESGTHIRPLVDKIPLFRRDLRLRSVMEAAHGETFGGV